MCKLVTISPGMRMSTLLSGVHIVVHYMPWATTSSLSFKLQLVTWTNASTTSICQVCSSALIDLFSQSYHLLQFTQQTWPSHKMLKTVEWQRSRKAARETLQHKTAFCVLEPVSKYSRRSIRWLVALLCPKKILWLAASPGAQSCQHGGANDWKHVCIMVQNE
jgi:hypothetical protein